MSSVRQSVNRPLVIRPLVIALEGGSKAGRSELLQALSQKSGVRVVPRTLFPEGSPLAHPDHVTLPTTLHIPLWMWSRVDACRTVFDVSAVEMPTIVIIESCWYRATKLLQNSAISEQDMQVFRAHLDLIEKFAPCIDAYIYLRTQDSNISTLRHDEWLLQNVAQPVLTIQSTELESLEAQVSKVEMFIEGLGECPATPPSTLIAGSKANATDDSPTTDTTSATDSDEDEEDGASQTQSDESSAEEGEGRTSVQIHPCSIM